MITRPKSHINNMASQLLCWTVIFSIFTFKQRVSCLYDAAKIVYQLDKVDYAWTSDSQKQAAIASGDYIVENNIITGIKVYGARVFVTVPRWRRGVPATLNVLLTVPGTTGSVVMKPFPSWEMNRIGDCAGFQYVQSMEVDPNTGLMWIIDVGRLRTSESTPQNVCPPKLVVLDIKSTKIIRQHVFPPAVVSPSSNFMNDIVLDYIDGRVRYAYITDTADGRLYVYDYNHDDSYFFRHETMLAQPLLPDQHDLIAAPIDGIAMSADFMYVYYSTLTDRRLYAVSTMVLRDRSSDFANNVTHVGDKLGGSDGMVCGQRSLFYAAFEQNAVAKVTIPKHGLADLSTETIVVSNSTSVVWVDTFAFNGTYLWFVANKLNTFFRNEMNFTSGNPNMFIWKVNVNETGYLDRTCSASLDDAGLTCQLARM